jgi:hypothetical protein
MGTLEQVARGDQFLIHTGILGQTWTLTITDVQTDHSTGTLEPSQKEPMPVFPRTGFHAALILKK